MSADEIQGILQFADVLAHCAWTEHAYGIYRQVAEAGVLIDPEKVRALRDDVAAGAVDLGGHQPCGVKGDQVISSLHFTTDLTDHQKRVAFRSGVRSVSIETSSQCNRRCTYCSNSTHDRFTNNTFMPWPVFEKVIGELAQIEYCGSIQFHGYNEPLMHHEDLLERIRYTRSNLPLASLKIFSNGDYLTRPLLDALIEAGVTEIELSIHLSRGKTYNDSDMLCRIQAKANELGLSAALSSFVPGNQIRFHLGGGGVEIMMLQRNYMALGHNRGDILKDVGKKVEGRTDPCIQPLSLFVIVHTGNVTPCCTLVGDAPEHLPYVAGNVAIQSIFDIYSGETFVQWRRHLMVAGVKGKPCGTCSANVGYLGDTGWTAFAGQAIALADALEAAPLQQAAS